MDDLQILEGLRNGDINAFERLYDSLSSIVIYYTEQITKDVQEAEDITHQSFVKLWQQDLSQFDTMKKVKNFIFFVAKNFAIDFLRKKRTKHIHQGDIIHLTEQEEYQIDRTRYEVEILQKVFEEIEKLPERTREVFKMVYVDEMTSKEVGRQLNISDVTVRRLCSEALQKLRSKFPEKDFKLILLLLSLCELEKAHLFLSMSLH